MSTIIDHTGQVISPLFLRWLETQTPQVLNTWCVNKIYMLSVLIAHNLTRELQMIAYPASRATREKRQALW